MYSTQVASRRTPNSRAPDYMGRWTQNDEDAERLPEGFRRIAYDSETRRYTFQDRRGVVYESEPGNEFGVLTAVTSATLEARILKSRPNAFESSDPAQRRTTMPAHSKLSSFDAFVPSEAIAPPSSAESSSKRVSSANPSDGVFRRIKNIKAAVSKMQDVASKPRRAHAGHSASYSHPPSASSYETPAPSAPVGLPSHRYRSYTDDSGDDLEALIRELSRSRATSTSSLSSTGSSYPSPASTPVTYRNRPYADDSGDDDLQQTPIHEMSVSSPTFTSPTSSRGTIIASHQPPALTPAIPPSQGYRPYTVVSSDDRQVDLQALIRDMPISRPTSTSARSRETSHKASASVPVGLPSHRNRPYTDVSGDDDLQAPIRGMPISRLAPTSPSRRGTSHNTPASPPVGLPSLKYSRPYNDDSEDDLQTLIREMPIPPSTSSSSRGISYKTQASAPVPPPSQRNRSYADVPRDDLQAPIIEKSTSNATSISNTSSRETPSRTSASAPVSTPSHRNRSSTDALRNDLKALIRKMSFSSATSTNTKTKKTSRKTPASPPVALPSQRNKPYTDDERYDIQAPIREKSSSRPRSISTTRSRGTSHNTQAAAPVAHSNRSYPRDDLQAPIGKKSVSRPRSVSTTRSRGTSYNTPASAPVAHRNRPSTDFLGDEFQALIREMPISRPPSTNPSSRGTSHKNPASAQVFLSPPKNGPYADISRDDLQALIREMPISRPPSASTTRSRGTSYNTPASAPVAHRNKPSTDFLGDDFQALIRGMPTSRPPSTGPGRRETSYKTPPSAPVVLPPHRNRSYTDVSEDDDLQAPISRPPSTNPNSRGTAHNTPASAPVAHRNRPYTDVSGDDDLQAIIREMPISRPPSTSSSSRGTAHNTPASAPVADRNRPSTDFLGDDLQAYIREMANSRPPSTSPSNRGTSHKTQASAPVGPPSQRNRPYSDVPRDDRQAPIREKPISRPPSTGPSSKGTSYRTPVSAPVDLPPHRNRPYADVSRDDDFQAPIGEMSISRPPSTSPSSRETSYRTPVPAPVVLPPHRNRLYSDVSRDDDFQAPIHEMSFSRPPSMSTTSRTMVASPEPAAFAPAVLPSQRYGPYSDVPREEFQDNLQALIREMSITSATSTSATGGRGRSSNSKRRSKSKVFRPRQAATLRR